MEHEWAHTKCVQRVCNFDCSQRCSGNAAFTLIMRKTQRECANRRCNWRNTLRRNRSEMGGPQNFGVPGAGYGPRDRAGTGVRSLGSGTGPRRCPSRTTGHVGQKKASFCKGENTVKPKGTKQKKRDCRNFRHGLRSTLTVYTFRKVGLISFRFYSIFALCKFSTL